VLFLFPVSVFASFREHSYISLFLLSDLSLSAIMNTIPEYTKQYLALRNGQDKSEIWVAYKGLIYDVSGSRLWRNGKHYEHWAGQDLTDEMKDAPHAEAVFEKFDVIGKLI
jgi:predicted heme/steroid binding protein